MKQHDESHKIRWDFQDIYIESIVQTTQPRIKKIEPIDATRFSNGERTDRLRCSFARDDPHKQQQNQQQHFKIVEYIYNFIFHKHLVTTQSEAERSLSSEVPMRQ